MTAAFFLVDGNSFYCSCERAFDPKLRGKPVVVLSNNDGCVISRTAEAKALGVAMGEPWHLARRRPELAAVRWFSSNYPLYADMSRRMFEVMASFSPDIEPYSIDEMFLSMEGEAGELLETAKSVHEEVLRVAKIPTCVGIGPTKTIAKLANKHAKNSPDLRGVCDLGSPEARTELFRTWPVSEVWGIGPRSSAKLAAHGVRTVAEFLDMPSALVRREMSVVGARTQDELRGVPCLPLSLSPPTRKNVAATRTFGTPIEGRATEEAVAAFACRAAERLRKLGLAARHISVFLRTGEFREGPRHSCLASAAIEPTADSLFLSAVAARLARENLREGIAYAKGGVMLGDLSPAGETADLLPSRDPVRSSRLMQAIDAVSARHGRNALRPAACGTTDRWAPRQGNLGNRFTTDIRELLKAKA